MDWSLKLTFSSSFKKTNSYFLGVRSYSGTYSCMVENTVGLSDIVDIVSVYVEDVPNVKLTLFPLKPIR